MSRSLLAVLLIGCLWAAPSSAADKRASAHAKGDAVADVLHMLDEGVGSNVIVDWLSRTTPVVRPVGPDDLIRLSKAGASDTLVQKLLDLAAAPRARTPQQPSPPPRPVPPDTPAPDGPNDGSAGLALSLHYRPQSDSGDERGRRWAMLAYLDGEPAIAATSQKDPFRTTLRIEPGTHVIHLLRESHLERKRGWRHESFVGLQPITFTVEAGEGWHLEIDWVVPTFDFSRKGPLSWTLTRWGARVAGEARIGERLEDWPRLCEDVEANAPEGKKTPGWVERDLKGCVRWPTLWEEAPAAPDRATVRTALEALDFRP